MVQIIFGRVVAALQAWFFASDSIVPAGTKNWIFSFLRASFMVDNTIS